MSSNFYVLYGSVSELVSNDDGIAKSYAKEIPNYYSQLLRYRHFVTCSHCYPVLSPSSTLTLR